MSGVDKIVKQFSPECPSCGAGGERQRRKRGKWVCLECGERYTTGGEA